MICPTCGAEYVPGVQICSDCDIDLVGALPEATARGAQTGWAGGCPSDPQDGFSLVTVFATSDPSLAMIAETMLQSAGIPVIIEGTRPEARWGGGPLGLHAPSGPSIVRVAPRDAHDAREILADLQR